MLIDAPPLAELIVPPALPVVAGAAARAFAPRRDVTVSQWADAERVLSPKGSAAPGQWVTDRNPPTREPMDALSVRSSVHEVTLMWPIQFAKSEVGVNLVGYVICEAGGPIMVCFPGEVSVRKWTAQKLNPMVEDTPAVRERLTSVASREAANRSDFKDFEGGQLYIEHAGSPARLKSTSARWLVVDEFDEFAAQFVGNGDDPAEMLDGRTSAFPSTYKRLYISSPQMLATSRIYAKFLEGDQRRYHVPCPHCGHRQHLKWDGLKWADTRHPQHGRHAWYQCEECGKSIEEHHKTWMIEHGAWVAGNPMAPSHMRSYHINCLYYQFGLGPRWGELAEMWIGAKNDPAKRKVFINDRLAEPWEDESSRRVKHEALADQAEHYFLRTAPEGVLAVTAGVDTQDDRLAVQIVGWGRGLAFWVLDYVEIPGDPSGDEVWHSLAKLLTAQVLHESGCTMPIEAYAQDAAGHKTEDVKAFIRRARSLGVRRPLCIFGAKPANAPILKKGQTSDITWRNQVDKSGLQVWHVGTVAAKHWLFGRISLDARRDAEFSAAVASEEANARSQARATKPVPPPARTCHFTSELPEDYFPGLTSEVFDPAKGRYDKKRGVKRNEPLDTWVYAFAAAHHPDLRLHRYTAADWDRRAADLRNRAAAAEDARIVARGVHPQEGVASTESGPTRTSVLASAEAPREQALVIARADTPGHAVPAVHAAAAPRPNPKPSARPAVPRRWG